MHLAPLPCTWLRCHAPGLDASSLEPQATSLEASSLEPRASRPRASSFELRTSSFGLPASSLEPRDLEASRPRGLGSEPQFPGLRFRDEPGPATAHLAPLPWNWLRYHAPGSATLHRRSGRAGGRLGLGFRVDGLGFEAPLPCTWLRYHAPGSATMHRAPLPCHKFTF
jgi:hypothetical protein